MGTGIWCHELETHITKLSPRCPSTQRRHNLLSRVTDRFPHDTRFVCEPDRGCCLSESVVEGDVDGYRAQVFALAGRKVAWVDSGDASSGNPVRSHALESATLCMRRGIAAGRRLGNLLLPSRRRYVVCVSAWDRTSGDGRFMAYSVTVIPVGLFNDSLVYELLDTTPEQLPIGNA